ncbi:hypothetical protein F4556_003306 [Kitasatospora gansuensis]|uniref:Uncharacterized protein n=1 Tax=Kitasatospora gansuensis TaxID=258050 RepID=A0A7W7SE79_9ACTN|nr:hypothetical protein [Kitasatospora gansuensis]MBB4947771.1 hypothetical protein [Kitasatospora gansuensis]
MTKPTTKTPTCGARRPGWENGFPVGRHRIPCVLDPEHQDDHANGLGDQWPQNDSTERRCSGPWDCQLCDREFGPRQAEPIKQRCCRCNRPTATPVLVGAIKRQSGPAWSVYACPEDAPAVRKLLGQQ